MTRAPGLLVVGGAVLLGVSPVLPWFDFDDGQLPPLGGADALEQVHNLTAWRVYSGEDVLSPSWRARLRHAGCSSWPGTAGGE